MRRLALVGLFLAPALLVGSAQAGATKPQAQKVKKAANPIWTLAMDGSRVAYVSGGKIRVWNVAAGTTSVVKGSYGNTSRYVNGTAAEVAIAGRRVAWIRRQWLGNTEASEKLYTAQIGGSAHLLTHAYRYGRNDPSQTNGGWIAGLVGSGKVLAVSSWKSNGMEPSDARLSTITPSGRMRSIVTGPGAIVAESADAGRIAVLRSTVAWPSDDQMPLSAAPTVGIYSAAGALLNEVALTPPDPDTVATEIGLSGNRLVVLTSELHQSGPASVSLAVYDPTTGALLHTWSVGIHSDVGMGVVRLAVSGRLAAVEGSSRLHVVDLDTGKDVEIALSSHTDSPAAIGPRGLVYVTGSGVKGPWKLTFVPMVKLLARLGS